MKIYISIFLILLNEFCCSQDLSFYRDTANKFSIGIPNGWTQQIINEPTSTIKLNVFRPRMDETDNPREVYKVDLLSIPNSNLDLVYRDILKNSSLWDKFKLLAEGDTIINNRKYKWFKEEHENMLSKETMTAYVYLGYKAPLAYMVTFVTTAALFDQYESLFRKISSSFRL